MTAFYLIMFVLPVVIIALALILAYLTGNKVKL